MAKRAKTQTQGKKQPEKMLVKAPAEYVFWCHDGSVFADLRELAEGLAAMSDETFAYHSNLEKQDFSNWVRDIIRDEPLANDLARAISKAQAAEYVNARMAFLISR